MKKRFIVALNSTTETQNLAFQLYIKSLNVGWWHWLANLWLIVDYKGQLNSEQLRNKLLEIYPTINNIVIELRPDDDTWSGYGPKNDVRDMFPWLTNYWNK